MRHTSLSANVPKPTSRRFEGSSPFLFLPLFTRVLGREILRSSFAATCIVHTYRARLLPGSWPDAYKSTLPVVVALDKDARSCNPRTAPTVPGVHHHRGFLCTLSNPSLVSYTRSTAQQPNLSAAYRCAASRGGACRSGVGLSRALLGWGDARVGDSVHLPSDVSEHMLEHPQGFVAGRCPPRIPSATRRGIAVHQCSRRHQIVCPNCGHTGQ
jgi:hypothetical protein